MPDLFLVTDADLEHRMFPYEQDETPQTFVPGFIADADFVPFKDSISDAMDACIKAGSPQARYVVHHRTSWWVMKIQLSFDEIGRMTHANTIRRSKRGYHVFKTLAKEAKQLTVRWPQWTVKKWLVNRGYKTSDAQIDRACTKDNCRDPHPSLYQLKDGKFMCEKCLAEHEGIAVPVPDPFWDRGLVMEPPAAAIA